MDSPAWGRSPLRPHRHPVSWDSCRPSPQVAPRIQGWGTFHPIPPQWSLCGLLSLCPTLDNGLVCSVEQSIPHSKSTDCVGPSAGEDSSSCDWEPHLNTPDRLAWGTSSSPSAGQGSSNSEVSPLPVPGAEHTPDANLCFPRPLGRGLRGSGLAATTQSLQGRTFEAAISVPWGLRGKNLTLGGGRALNLFFLSRDSLSEQFPFPPSGIGHSPASHSRPIPKTQAGGRRNGWNPVLRGWFLFG